MLRMTKQADYGIVLLSQMAALPEHRFTAPELAQDTHLPLPMVSKILKILSRAGILQSHRGAKGGYSLAASPRELSVARLITALDGPIAFTECSDDHTAGLCSQEASCRIRHTWQHINQAVRNALDAISLAELALAPHHDGLIQLGRPRGSETEMNTTLDLLAERPTTPRDAGVQPAL